MAKRKKKTPRDRALTVRVTREGVLTIEIGIDTLARCAVNAPFAWASIYADEELEPSITPSDCFVVTNARGFASDVARALLDEAEDGTSPLTTAIDDACETAVNDGSQFWLDKEQP